MCNDPIDDHRVIEALEACRPGTGDSALPELGLNELLAADARLRELHKRLELADSRLQAAMGDVAVPEGLDERILARLAVAGEQLPVVTARRGRRRWWIAAAGLMAVAASLFVAVWVGASGTAPHDEAGVLAAVCWQFSQESELERAKGRLLAERDPPAQFPMSRAVPRIADIRWRTVRGLFGRQAVAYDFPGVEGRRATLYVSAVSSTSVVRTRPPEHPMHSTGGLCASVWREGDRLYVLVVRGDIRAYRRLILPPSRPLT